MAFKVSKTKNPHIKMTEYGCDDETGQQSNWPRFMVPAVIACLLISLAWNIYLSIAQATLSQQISDLEVIHQRLLNIDARKQMSHDPPEETIMAWEKPLSERVRRDVESERTPPSKKDRMKKKCRKNKISGVHFKAFLDEERMSREIAEGNPTTIGKVTKYGFQPKERIYNIWKPESWHNVKMFQYNSTSGKVKVRSAGLYLIYGQMMFHSPSARKSFGIHINDDTTPFVEALSFSDVHEGRSRRHVESESNNTQSLYYKHMRSKRSIYASYSQCNTLAVTYLNKNDEVFLKSLEYSRIIIPKGYLTFWGIVKM